jgi:hypothetical protein
MKLLFLMMKITLTQFAIPKSSCGIAKGLVSSKHFAVSKRGHPKPEFISQLKRLGEGESLRSCKHTLATALAFAAAALASV